MQDTVLSPSHGVGKRVIDISDLIDVFEAQEGEVQHIIGKTGMGKTYEATRRAYLYLMSGYTVYTTWRLNLPEYYDERESFWKIFKNIILFRKNFYKFDLSHNWHHVDLKSFEDEEGIMDTEKLARYLATITDAIFMLDEGQDVFDSHKKSGQIARQSITRTRHMHKTLIIISQRAQAVDVTARGNVTYFYKCVKKQFPFLPAYFRVYRTEDIDESSNYPLWVRHDSQGTITWQAPVWHKGFAKKYIYNLYDSWYMRQNMIRSQDIKFDAYELTFGDKFRALFRTFSKKKSRELPAPSTAAKLPALNDVEYYDPPVPMKPYEPPVLYEYARTVFVGKQAIAVYRDPFLSTSTPTKKARPKVQ